MRIVSSSAGMGSSETSDGGTGVRLRVMQQHLRRRARLENELPGQRPVGGARQRIEIGPAVDRGLAEHQFGRHERRRALQDALRREHRRFRARG